MAATNVVKDGLEGYLYYNTNAEAEYASGVTSGWTLIGYVTGFNYENNDGSRAVYDHYEVDHYKRGRETNSGSISHLYTNKTNSLLGLKGSTIALKLEIRDDGGATVSEYHLLSKVRIGRTGFNMPETGDITSSADFTFGSSTVDSPA